MRQRVTAVLGLAVLMLGLNACAPDESPIAGAEAEVERVISQLAAGNDVGAMAGLGLADQGDSVYGYLENAISRIEDVEVGDASGTPSVWDEAEGSVTVHASWTLAGEDGDAEFLVTGLGDAVAPLVQPIDPDSLVGTVRVEGNEPVVISDFGVPDSIDLLPAVYRVTATSPMLEVEGAANGEIVVRPGDEIVLKVAVNGAAVADIVETTRSMAQAEATSYAEACATNERLRDACRIDELSALPAGDVVSWDEASSTVVAEPQMADGDLAKIVARGCWTIQVSGVATTAEGTSGALELMIDVGLSILPNAETVLTAVGTC